MLAPPVGLPGIPMMPQAPPTTTTLLDLLGSPAAQDMPGREVSPYTPDIPEVPQSKGDVLGKEVQTDLEAKGVPASLAKDIAETIKEAADTKGAPLNAREVQEILDRKGVSPSVIEVVKDTVKEVTQAIPTVPPAPQLIRPGQTTAAPPGLAGPPHAAPQLGPNVQMGRSAQEALGKGVLGPLYDMIFGNKGPAIGLPRSDPFVGPTPASGRFGLNDMGLPNEPGIVQQAPYLPSGDPGGLQDAVPGSRGLDLTGDPGGLQDAPARGAEPIVDVPAPPAVPPTIDLPSITNEKTAPTEREGPDLPTSPGGEAPLVSETPGILGVLAEALGLDSGEIRVVKNLARQAGVPAAAILAMAKRLADDTGVSTDMALQIVMQSLEGGTPEWENAPAPEGYGNLPAPDQVESAIHFGLGRKPDPEYDFSPGRRGFWGRPHELRS
jgi:hypothetical protein